MARLQGAQLQTLLPQGAKRAQCRRGPRPGPAAAASGVAAAARAGGRRDFLSGRGAEGSRCQPGRRRPAVRWWGFSARRREAGRPRLPVGGRARIRASECVRVRECVSVARRVSPAAGSASSPAAAAHGVSQCEAAAPAPG